MISAICLTQVLSFVQADTNKIIAVSANVNKFFIIVIIRLVNHHTYIRGGTKLAWTTHTLPRYRQTPVLHVRVSPRL